MHATYTPAGGENAANLRWVQMFDTTQSGKHIDPFPNNDEGAAGSAGDLPFYYTEAEHANFGMTFVDNPQIGPTLPVPFNYSARFEVYLVTANFTTNTVTVHDGIRWGYDVVTVPEPTTMVVLAIGAVATAFGRRRRSTR